MKTKLIVFLAAVLALMMSVPTGAGAVGVGKTCGGFPGLQCDAGLFCEQKPGQCKIADMSGVCVKVPAACPKHHIVLPVCGCNHMTYGNDCERKQVMTSLAHKGKCM